MDKLGVLTFKSSYINGKNMELNCGYSVALCTYNGEKYIAEQLKSILKQSVPPKQIIISDDGSKDKTLKVAKDILCNSSVEYKIVENLNNHGVTNNFSNAISLCTEEMVFTSDQDDVWIENKAEIMLKIFNENKSALLVFSNGELVDSALNLQHCDMWKSVGITDEMLKSGNYFEFMLKRSFVTGAAMAFKRELFSTEEGIPISWLHDGWLAWKAFAQNGLVPCKEKLILYRQHSNNVVGMSNAISGKRMKNYLRNFKTMKDTHMNRYNKYTDLKKEMGNMFSEHQQEELNDCIFFWKDLVECDKSTKKLTRMSIIRKHMKNGDFEKYFTGKRGAIRELLIVLWN